jgi:hypothetical protein
LHVGLGFVDGFDDLASAVRAQRVVLRKVVPTTLPAEPPPNLTQVAVGLEFEMELYSRLVSTRTYSTEAPVVTLDQGAA